MAKCPIEEFIGDGLRKFAILRGPGAASNAPLATGFENIGQHRVAAVLDYADADDACHAAFVGGPMALAWSRFDADVRARVSRRYVEAIDAWRHGQGYRVPGEFVVVAAIAGGDRAAPPPG